MTRLFEAKPYIVAEVGSNHNGLEHCVESIARAKSVGANAVKFQMFNPDAMYGMGGDYQPESVAVEWLPKLREKADACGIDFACTAFSPELVAAVDPFVAWHKVASSDATWPQLLAAIKATGKPIVLSVGAKGRADIVAALQALGGEAASRTALMYCVAAYPSRMVDLRVLEQFFDEFVDHVDFPWPPRGVGFSDHTRDIIGHPVEAAQRGAVVIEKHFTAFPELDTPDRPHSLTPDEFRTMVEYIRGIRKPCIGPTPEERDMITRHNRRLIATRDVEPGEPLAYGVNFGAYRSLKDDHRGLSPFAWRQVEGSIAITPIARGAAIGPGDFSQGNAHGKTPRHLWPQEYR